MLTKALGLLKLVLHGHLLCHPTLLEEPYALQVLNDYKPVAMVRAGASDLIYEAVLAPMDEFASFPGLVAGHIK